MGLASHKSLRDIQRDNATVKKLQDSKLENDTENRNDHFLEL